MKLFGKYKTLSRLGKAFVWLSIAVVTAVIAFYVVEVLRARAMDPNSYNCLHDSMMKQLCEDPYGSSVSWAIIEFVFLGWPLWIVWAVIGLVLLGRRATAPSSKSKPSHPGKIGH